MLEELEHLAFHNNQTPEQIQELEAIRTSIEELVNKDPQTGIEKSKEYLTLVKKYLHQEHVANFLYLYAALHYLTGKNAEALDISKLAIIYSINLELKYRINVLLGAIYTYFGEFNKAIEVYDFALKTNISTSSSSVYNNIAAIYFKQKDYNLAIEYFNKALELSDGNTNLILTILNNIGRAYIELKDLKNAELILFKVSEILNDAENPTQEMIYNLNIGLLYYKQDLLKDAFTKLLDAYLKCKKLNLKNNLYSATLFLAYACTKYNKLDQANTYYLETLDLVRGIDNRLYNASLKDYIDFLVSQNDFERCISYFKEYDQLKDEIIKEDKEKEISALTVKFQNTEQKLEIEKLHKEKEFQKQLLVQADEVKRTNERLIKSHHKLHEANIELMESKILRSQMNPDFLYNSIESIKALIIDHKNIEADNYLFLFSTLTRKIFDNNTRKSISLSEELDFCRKYIELEKLQFRKAFNYIEEIEEEVLLNNPQIPSMIIQPLIENAIKYSLIKEHKEHINYIHLKIKKVGQEIIFEIIDNGVGIKKISKSLISIDKENSLSIVNKRINIFNKKSLGEKSLMIQNNDTFGVTCSFKLNNKS